MKKLVLIAATALVVFGSCNKSAGPKPSLKTNLDTVSYELGVANSQGLKQYLSERLGVDTAYMDEFYKGVIESSQAGENKKKAAYYAGIQIGQQIGTQMFKGLNYQLFGDDSTKTISMRNFLSGFIAATQGKNVISLQQVQKELQQRVTSYREKSLSKTYGANKVAGEKFIAENKNKPGIKTLPNGTQYRVIKEGNGPIPTDTSTILVSYEGRLVNGKIFDSSYKNNNGKPIQVQVKDMIPGWIDALTHMPEGSVWELYIPQEQAYASREAGDLVKPFSALIFKLELVKVQK